MPLDLSKPIEAFDELVTYYRGKVYAMIVNMIRSDADAWDLAQDPGETSRAEVGGHALETELGVLCGRVDEMYKLPPPKENDAELVEALKAVGYMEE